MFNSYLNLNIFNKSIENIVIHDERNVQLKTNVKINFKN